MDQADFEKVVEQGRQLQVRLAALSPVAVGGTAAAIHCGHRFSLDVDVVTPHLAARFDEVLADLEAWDGWHTNRQTPRVLILGERAQIELGVRQQRRSVPLHVTRREGLTVPTAAEMLRIKAFLLGERPAVRDFVDVSALILIRVQVEPNNPRPGSQASQALGIAGQPRQAEFQLANYSFQRIEDSIGKLFLTQFVPDMFLRIEFRGISGQAQEAHVLRNAQVLRFVGTGTIHDHDQEFRPVGLTDLREEFVHPFGVHVRGDFPVQLTLHRTHGPVDIHELALVTIGYDGPQWFGSPTAPKPYHPAKPRFVLEQNPHRSPLDRFGGQQGRHVFREFFFQSSWTWGSLLG